MSNSKKLFITGVVLLVFYLIIANLTGQLSVLIFIFAVLFFLGSISEYIRAKVQSRLKHDRQTGSDE